LVQKSFLATRIHSTKNTSFVFLTSKGTLASGEDNGANLRVVVVLLQDLVELDKETIAEGVEGLGTVEGDEGNLTTGLGQEVLELGGLDGGNGIYCVM